jgi:hypothetical protein
VAEEVPEHGADDRGAEVLAEPAGPGRQTLEPAEHGRGRIRIDDLGFSFAFGGKSHRINFL